MTAKRSLFLLACLFVPWALDLFSGSSPLTIAEVWSALGSGPGEYPGTAHEVVWQIRLPKSLAAALAGAALSVAGLQLQTLFRTPLAGPYELGISSGAAFGMACFTMLGTPQSVWSRAGALGSAVLGAAAIMVLLALIAPWLRSAASLLLAGLLISSALGAGVAALQYRSDAGSLQAFVDWTLGSVGGVTWGQLGFFAPVCLAGLAAAFLGAKSLNALLLGDEEARSLGAGAVRARFAIAACAGLLAALVAAYCGPVAFVGLGMPHVARWMLGGSDHRVLIPAAAALGAAAVLTCDALASISGQPLNVVASGLGAPLVLAYLLRRRAPGEG
jgi:iron complex transport system permease protein